MKEETKGFAGTMVFFIGLVILVALLGGLEKPNDGPGNQEPGQWAASVFRD